MAKILLHIIPSIGLGFIMQVIIHEAGHLIGGALTGWKFLYLQLYRLVLVREDRKIKIKVVNEIGYRCIMYPLSIEIDAMFYTIGGCMVNLLTAFIGVLILITARMNLILWLYTWSFTAFGIGLFAMNGTSCIKRVCNDKACYDMLKSDKRTKLCHNAQLVIAKYLMKGLTYRQISEDGILLCTEVSHNDIQAYQAVLEYYYYLDRHDFIKMEQSLNKIRDKNNISKEILDIVEMELIYLRLLLDLNLHTREVHDCIINLDDIGIIIKKHERYGDVHTLRIKALYKTYISLVEENKVKALNKLDKAINEIYKLNFIYEGEMRFCINQLSKVKDIINVDINSDEINKEKPM